MVAQRRWRGTKKNRANCQLVGPIYLWSLNVSAELRLPPRWMGDARVEVLLRQQAFKPKSDVDGKKLTGEDGRSTLGFNN